MFNRDDEPSDPPTSPVVRDFESQFFCGDWVIATVRPSRIYMENPYASDSLSNAHSSKSWFFANVLIALVPICVIATNYATATTIPRELWDVFAHVVFLIAPVSFLIHLPNLIARNRETTSSTTRWWVLALLLIPASFLLSISPLTRTTAIRRGRTFWKNASKRLALCISSRNRFATVWSTQRV